MPEDFGEIAAAPAENVKIARVRIPLQLLLNLKRKTLHPAPHVGVASRDPDPATRRQWDHDRRAFNVAAITADGAPAPIFTRTSFSSTSTTTCGATSSVAGAKVAGAAGAASMTTGENPKVGVASLPPRRTPPFIDEARAHILATRYIGDHGARLGNRRQYPRPVFVAPSAAPLATRDQCHPTHAVQLASLIKPT